MDPHLRLYPCGNIRGAARELVEQWLEQTSHPKLRDDQSLLAMAIYCGEVDMATTQDSRRRLTCQTLVGLLGVFVAAAAAAVAGAAAAVAAAAAALVLLVAGAVVVAQLVGGKPAVLRLQS